MVLALPDGEPGPRAAWVGYEREQLVRPHADVETVAVMETMREHARVVHAVRS